jgi:hypothetical protein
VSLLVPDRSLRRRLAALALALASSVVGCRGEPERDIYYVRLVSVDANDGPALPEERVHAIVRRSLDQSLTFDPAERDQRSGAGSGTILAATFEYRELPRGHGEGRDLLVRLALETPRELVEALGPEGLDATVLLAREAGDVELDDDLQLAADRLARIVQARTDLARGQAGRLAALLDSGDPELVATGLTWLRDHPDAPEADEQLERTLVLLDAGDVELRLLAIEALGAIGGPEQVAALLERIDLHDGDQVARAYDALARLGGAEARRFLEFAAANEDEPNRQAAAERALQRLEGHSASLSEQVRGRGHR